MYGFLYVTVNLLTGQKYIGKCSYKDTEVWRTYLGSGANLKKDIEKYGREYFFRIILKEYKTKEDLDAAEKELIELLDAKNDELFYNLVDGGGRASIEWTEERHETVSQKIKNEYTDVRKQEASERMKKYNQKRKEISTTNNSKNLNSVFGKRGVLNPNNGTARKSRQLTEEHKQHISKAKTGLKNSKKVKAVVCEETNTLYESLNLASKLCNVDRKSILRATKENSYKCKNMHWHIATQDEIEEYLKSKKKDDEYEGYKEESF